MATFLDVTGLEHFSSIFVFIFVIAVVYATLVWTKLLGDNQFINILVGVVIGFFVLISPLATRIVTIIVPLSGVYFVLLLVTEMAIKMMGLEAYTTVKNIFFIIGLLLPLTLIGIELRESADVPSETQSDLSKTINLVFHPTFIGMVLILVISVFTVALLTSKTL
ncbi:MAG: hypothetical protein AABX33_08695 [Nanoarchaeota archaeon]